MANKYVNEKVLNTSLSNFATKVSKNFPMKKEAIKSLSIEKAVPTGSTGTNKKTCLKVVYSDDSLVDSKGQTVNHIVYLDLSTLGGSGTGTGDVSFKEYAPNTEYKTGDLIVNNNIIYKVPADFTSTTDIATDISNGDLTTYIGTEIVDNLTTQNSNKALSANQGYVLSQKFMKNIQFSSLTKTVDITYLNGTTNSFSLKTFIDDVCKTLAQGKAIYCDKLPTCAQDANGDYIVTYILGGKTLTTNAENTWFYYKNSNNSYVQTLFVAGTEITMEAGAIGDVVTINKTTKHWLINGIDTGVLAQGISPKITPNVNNTDSVYKLDVQYYDPDKPIVDESGNPVYEDDGVTQKKGMDVKYTTDNLKGADGVILDNAGMFGLRVENNQLMLYVNVPDSTTGNEDDIAPPFSLEGNTLYYTVNGKIQYVSKQTI